MKKVCVVRNGELLNVGEWDHQITTDDFGNSVEQNPFPEGSVQGEYDVELTADGGYVLANDYRNLRKAEYPTIGDQLDAIWKGGEYTDQMRQVVLSIKEKYPKE